MGLMCHGRRPSLFLSLVPIAVLIAFLVVNVILFKDEATAGPNQLALFFSALVALFLGWRFLRVSYQSMEKQMISSISHSLQACLILLLVGALIGIWIVSGIVPTMIYYGLEIINPSLFLPIACITCALVALSTGSSWSTTGTVGIALIGMGQALAIPEGMVAGAIISGAYFGDKMSPMSDTTNLAPAMAGTDLFTHIRHMVYSSLPAFLIALLGFVLLSFFYGGQDASVSTVSDLTAAMKNNFRITPFLLLVPCCLVLMVAKKIPALPAMTMGIFAGILCALLFQLPLLEKMSGGGNSGISGIYMEIVRVAASGFKIDSGHEIMNGLFNRGGMSSMLQTIWLIMMAMTFGGALEATGMLAVLASSMLKLVSGAASLLSTVVLSCLLLNITVSDQYLAIVVPGHMFRDSFDKFGLHAKNLSRALEDSGTVTSVLVPWNSCGAYNAGVLGVSTLTYLPFCFFNLASPLMSIILAVTGFTIEKKSVE